MLQYVQDYDEMFPYYSYGSYTVNPWVIWPDQLQPYVKNWDVYRCPSSPMRGNNYAYHGVTYPAQPNYGFINALWQTAGGYAMAKIEKPAEKYLCFDSSHLALGDERAILASTQCAQWSCGANVVATQKWLVPHMDGVNIGFIDGHVKWQAGNAVHDNIAWKLNPAAP